MDIGPYFEPQKPRKQPPILVF